MKCSSLVRDSSPEIENQQTKILKISYSHAYHLVKLKQENYITDFEMFNLCPENELCVRVFYQCIQLV